MPGQFFHGVQVQEVETTAASNTTLASSVIGLVGTAPNAQQSASAALAVGTVGANNGITLTAASAGSAGNDISLQIRIPNTANAALSIIVNADAITVFLATGGTAGTTTTTAAALITALEANTAVVALLAAAATGSSNGTGLMAAQTQTYLSGGLDAIAPLNTPVVINTESQIGLFGIGGSLPRALRAIFDQAQTAVVVVCVAQVTNSDSAMGTITNVTGAATGGAYTGLKALLSAESATGLHPRIIVAPGFSQNQAVAAEMLIEATALRAIAVIDGPSTTNAAAITYAGNFGDARLFMVDPEVLVEDSPTGNTVTCWASGRVAGLIAANDANNGFWTSPSNQVLQGVIGLGRSISFSFSDPNSDANTLNANNIATVIRMNGFRLWGNRTLSIDPNFAFLSVRRTADLIEDSIQQAHLWAVDRNITKSYVQEVLASVNGYLATLQALDAVLDYSVTADKDLNTAAAIQAGQVYFDVAFTPPSPAESVVFRVNPVATTGYASITS